MQMYFEELKSLYRRIYVNVDDLAIEGQQVTEEQMAASELAYCRLMLMSKLAAEICKWRPVQVDKK